MRMQILSGTAAVLALLVLVGCATKPPPTDCGKGDPDVKVADLHSAWLTAPSCTLHAGAPMADGSKTRSRAFLRRQAQNLSFRHPTHVPTRMLLAAMAYDANDPIDATRHLDYLLRLQPTHPEAAILRSRISIEEGNMPHAVRLLESQIRLRPDHAGLREALASAYFMTHDYELAQASLNAAETLGGRPERIAFNRGLIAEEQGDAESARRYYQLAEQHSPGWPRPMERLAGLQTDLPTDPGTQTASADPFAFPRPAPTSQAPTSQTGTSQSPPSYAPPPPPIPAATLR